MSPTILYPSCDFYCNDIHQPHNVQYSSSFAYRDYIANLSAHPPYSAIFPFANNPYYQSLRAMDTVNPTDMDDFQRLSDEYRAQLPGPLIGNKLPMSVLVSEYAQADPTYVVKTEALASNYSGYRTVKGDGQCGWRGTVFGYFETLLQLCDLDVIQQERVRLQSFEDTMRMAGIDYDIIIDMFDYTWELFDAIQRAVEQHNSSDTVILEYLNDEIKSDSIVYHFKMMTSAFMQLRADQYEPFLEVSIAEYRVARIDPSNQEIDQIGLQALTDAVIAPANIALEVLYLDRSMGGEVTSHSFVAAPAEKPTIHLLYRPGHYDIIYKEQISVQVYYQKDSMIPQGVEIPNPHGASGDLQAYLFSGPSMSQSHSQSGSFHAMDQGSNTHNTNQYLYQSQHQPTCIMPSPQYPVTINNQAMSFNNIEFPSNYPVQYASPCSTEMSSPAQPKTPQPQLQSRTSPAKSTSQKSANEPQIRLNANCFNYRLKHESVPLCTQTYGSAATLSTAHFRNQEFQPQMWKAEEEYLKS